MRALDRKMLRDLLRMKGQVIAIGAVIACGVAIYIGWQTTAESLNRSLADYYDRGRFAEVFTSLNRAPLATARRAAEIPGVDVVEARIVETVTLDLDSLNEPAVGRLISLPDRGVPALNRVHLVEGRFPEPGARDEIVAEEAFAGAHGFGPGDSIRAVLNGRLQELRIVGVGMSPEFITTIQPGSLFPDDKRFGIFWMRRDAMETAFDMEGAFNDLTLSLQPGATSGAVILRLDRLLERYGSLGATDRERQLSHRFVSDELAQLEAMTLVPPTIFLGVAAFLLNVVLRRVLSMQRSQIAVLEAFGYRSRDIGIHYGKFVGVIVCGGALVGCLAGTALGRALSDLYSEFYRFPETVFAPSAGAFLIGFGLSLVAAFAGVFGAVREALSIPPAEAMRPEAPAVYRLSVFERLGWHRWMSRPFRMILRELLRRPVRAMLTSLGIAFACAVLVIGNFGKDAIDYLVGFQFGLQQRQDASILFHEAVPRRVVTSLGHIEGVTTVEPFRSVPVRLRSGPHSRQLGIMGLPARRDLFRLLDKSERVVDLPPDGLVLSAHLAAILRVAPGDEVRVEVLEKDRLARTARVVATVNDFAGSSAYMHIDALNRFLREPPLISGAHLDLDPAKEENAHGELKQVPLIAAVNLQRAAYQGFMDSFGENLLQFRIINVFFAGVIAVGVVYNSARITLSERSRQLATLRVIGFTRGEVSAFLLGELGLLTLVAIPAGWAIGYGLCWAIVANLPTEHFRIPLILSPSTFAFAGTVIALAAVLSGLIVRRGIDRLDLVSVLKSSE